MFFSLVVSRSGKVEEWSWGESGIPIHYNIGEIEIKKLVYDVLDTQIKFIFDKKSKVSYIMDKSKCLST